MSEVELGNQRLTGDQDRLGAGRVTAEARKLGGGRYVAAGLDGRAG
jgi:hypothetical protein